MSSTLGLLVALVAVGIYGYSLYYMETDKSIRSINSSELAGKLSNWGFIRFLTYQCLLIQLLNAILHVLAHFLTPLVKLRDFVFGGLAFPVGSVVVYSFWAVWHGMGRELIFPAKLDAVYPPWLNHATHTIIVPLNFLLAATSCHHHGKASLVLCLTFMLGYTAFLHYLKLTTGVYVYPYLEQLTDNQRHLYFAGTGLLAYLMHQLGAGFTIIVQGTKLASKTGQRSGQVTAGAAGKSKLKQK